MKVAAKTDKGLVREQNEDSFGYRENLFVVADGMGGHQAGEIASAIAVEKILGATLESDIVSGLQKAIHEANDAILRVAAEREEYGGMGTTVAVLYLQPDRAVVTHVGDSRIYQLNNKKLTQLTNDHSLVAELVKKGEITEAEAKNHPQRNILTCALGSQTGLDITIQEISVSIGDIFLLCSDGLTGLVNEIEIKEELLTENDLANKVDNLINLAKERGGTDNITVMLIEIT